MSVVILQQKLPGYKEFKSDVTQEQWSALVAPFSDYVRHQAANLAGHGWDVVLVGGDVLFIGSMWGDQRLYKTTDIRGGQGARKPNGDDHYAIPDPPDRYDPKYKALQLEKVEAWANEYRNQ